MDNGSNFCEHVYKNVYANPCPQCGRETHEIDWNRSKQEREEHIAKYGLFHNTGVWWSI